MFFFSLSLQAALLLSKVPKEIVGEPVNTKRLYDAVNVIISLQVLFTILVSNTY